MNWLERSQPSQGRGVFQGGSSTVHTTNRIQDHAIIPEEIELMTMKQENVFAENAVLLLVLLSDYLLMKR